MAKNFEDFEPIFGEATAEWGGPSSLPLRPFLFRVHALDGSRLRIHVTDFHSFTWEGIRSIQQLEDMRDDIGIGGSWSEFIDYLVASMKSDNVKLVLDVQSKSAGENDAAFAKLIARKSKGMPLVSIPLARLVNSSANEAMANLSLELFKEYKSQHTLIVKEQENSYQLTRLLSGEQDKNDVIQNQLDAVLFSKRQKIRKSSALDKASTLNKSDTLLISGTKDSPEKLSNQDPLSTKVIHRTVPAYRRAKVRGAQLQDSEDGKDE